MLSDKAKRIIAAMAPGSSKQFEEFARREAPKRKAASVDYATEFAGRLAAKRVVPSVGPGEKLVIGKDGTWQVEPNLERFAKAAKPELPQPSTPIQKAITEKLGAVLHVKTVGGRAALFEGLSRLSKRTDMPLISTEERLGAPPSVAPIGRPQTVAGLGDEDAEILARGTVALSRTLSLAEAQRLFAENYAVTRRNPNRRLTTESASFGIPYAAPDRW